MQYASVRDHTCCPIILIAGGGPYLTVLGAVLTDKEEQALGKYSRRGYEIVRRDWWEMMDDPANWTLDYFGDVSALGFTFRSRVEDAALAFPLVRTHRGWWVVKPYVGITKVFTGILYADGP